MADAPALAAASLLEAFSTSWPGRDSCPADVLRRLEDALEVAVAAARAAWPALSLSPATFVRHLGARIDGDPLAALAALHVEDLYLACACLTQDPAALAAFDAAHAEAVRVVVRVDASPPFLDEVKQRLRVHLFVGAAPKIADYSGRGPLAAWVRVVALRLAQMLRRGERHEVPGSDDDSGADARLAGDDPELELVKRRYGQAFNQAVADAVKALEPRARTVLRMKVLEGLNIDKIGAIYGVHRATVAAWIAAARNQVFDETRRLLGERLAVQPHELDSLMGLVRSQLDLSLSRLLGRPA